MAPFLSLVAGSDAARRALSLVAAAAGAEVELQGGEPTEGLNPSARRVIEAAGKGASDTLLGKTSEEQAEVAQWMTFCNTELGTVTDDKLFKVNAHLANQTFLALNRLTAADLLVFSSLSQAMAELPIAQTDQLCNLLRWYDMVQSTTAGADLYGRVTISKPALDTSPVAVPQAAAPSKTSNSSNSTATKGAPTAVPAASEGKKQEATSKGKKSAEAPAPAAVPAPAQGGDDGDGKKTDKKEKKEKKSKPMPVKQEVEVNIASANIRVGTITKVWRHPNAEALYCEEIDVGEEKPRQVVSGLVKFVPEDQMLNRRVIVVCNLKPAKMRDVMSYGMVLCASNDAHDQVVPLAPPEGVANGERLTFPGYDGEPEEVLNPKKKMWEKIAPDLKTDASGTANYKGAVFTTSKGPVVPVPALANGTVG